MHRPASADLKPEIDFCALFPESFTGRRPAALNEANLGLVVHGQDFSFKFPVAPDVGQKWTSGFDQSGLRRIGAMRYFEADFDYRLVEYRQGGAGPGWFLAEVCRMVMVDPVVGQVIVAINWEGGRLRDIGETMPADYSAAELLARIAVPKQHTHNVPIPRPM